MVHYAGINRTTSNAKGQNNILGQTINPSATIKIKKFKKKRQKNGEIFPGKSIFFMCSYFWAREKTGKYQFSSTFCNLRWRRVLCRRLVCLKEVQLRSPASRLDFSVKVITPNICWFWYRWTWNIWISYKQLNLFVPLDLSWGSTSAFQQSLRDSPGENGFKHLTVSTTSMN